MRLQQRRQVGETSSGGEYLVTSARSLLSDNACCPARGAAVVKSTCQPARKRSSASSNVKNRSAFSSCSSCSRIAVICSCWFASNRCADGPEDQVSRSTRLYGFDLSPAPHRWHSAMRGVINQPSCCPGQCLAHHLVQGVAHNLELSPLLKGDGDAASSALSLLPLHAPPTPTEPARDASLSTPLLVGAGQQELLRVPRSHSDGDWRDLFWSQWLVAHPLKDSHLFPLSRALHLLLINLSPVGDLVCHPLILLRLPQPLVRLSSNPAARERQRHPVAAV